MRTKISASFFWALALFFVCSFTGFAQAQMAEIAYEFPSVYQTDVAEVDDFPDVRPSHPKYQPVYFLKNQNIIQGYPDGEAKLENKLNRAEFVKILLEAKKFFQSDLEIYYDANHTFPDVPRNAWFAPYVSTAKRLNIIKGYPDGTFRPSQEINYPEAYKVIVETFGIKAVEDGTPGHLELFSEEWFMSYLKTVHHLNLSDELEGLGSYESLNQSISRGAAFDTLYRGYFFKTQLQKDGEAFYHEDVFFGNDQVVYSGFHDPYYLPVSYNGNTETLQGTLYRVPLEVFLESQKTQEGESCCIMRNRFGMQVSNDLVKKMDFVSEFKTDVKALPGLDPHEELFNGMISLPITNRGIYLLRVQDVFVAPEDVFIVASNLSLMEREGRLSSMVWLQHNLNSVPLDGVSIDFYEIGESVNKVQTLETDEKGVIETAPHSNAMVVEYKGDTAVLVDKHYPMHVRSDFEVAPVSSVFEERQSIHVYAYTDRPIYKPGDKVFFKGIVRDVEKDGYDIPSDSTVLVKIVTHSAIGEVIVYEEELPLSSYGSFHSDFHLKEDSITGFYSVSVEQNGLPYYAGDFQVESYRKREFDVSVVPSRVHYKRGDNVQVKVQGKYFFDAPLANKEVTYKVHKSIYYEPLYHDLNPFKTSFISSLVDFVPLYYEELHEEGTLTLNENGEATLWFEAGKENEIETPLNYFYKTKGLFPYTENPSLRFRIEVMATDESNLPVTETSSIIAHNTEMNFFISGPVQSERKKDIPFEILALDYDEEGYQGASLVFKVVREYGIPYECGERYDFWENEIITRECLRLKEEVVAEGTRKTDYQGQSVFHFIPNHAGFHRLEVLAYDKKEKAMLKTFRFYVSGIHDSKVEDFMIYSDKDFYDFGDKVTLTANPGIEKGTALVTIAKEDVLSTHRIKFRDQILEFEFEIGEEHIPSVQVYIDFLYEGEFVSGGRYIPVYPSNKALTIDVRPEREEVAPGEATSYIITALDSLGEPVEAELSFAVVDKAIFQFKKHEFHNIIKYFYNPKHYFHRMNTNAASTLLSKGDASYREIDMDDAEEAAPAPKEEKKASVSSGGVRKIFEDTAFFVADIETDFEGKARVEVQFPDNTTTWTGVAVGITKETQVGAGEVDVVATQDFIIRPHLPRFFTVGDEVEIQATVQSFVTGIQTFHIEVNQICLEGDNEECVFLALSNRERILLKDGESLTFTWKYTVPEYYKDGDVIHFEFKGEEKRYRRDRDEVQVGVPVYEYGKDKVSSAVGEGSFDFQVSNESGANLSNIKSIKLQLSPTLGDNLVNGLQYLVGYPYGCTEQTLSKFVPNLVAYHAKDEIDLKDYDLFEDIDEYTEVGIQRLYDFQHSDGGWGWWKNDASNPKMTAYAVYGLMLAKNSGFKVDNKVYGRGLEYLQSSLDSFDHKKYQPYVFYVLSQTENKDFVKGFVGKYLNASRISEISSTNLAYLLLGQHALGESPNSEIKRELENRIIHVGNTAYTKEEHLDYDLLGSNELATALTFEVLVRIDSRSKDIAKLLRYINSNTIAGVYHETHATAHAVIALVEYIKQQGVSGEDSSYRILWNDEIIHSGNLNNAEEISIDYNRHYFQGQENTIRLVNTGNGNVYYSLVMKELQSLEEVGAVNEGFQVRRSYHNKLGDKIYSATVGEVIKVELNVNSSLDASYVSIIDPIPAGFEIINPRLDESIDAYGFGFFDFRNIYDNHIAMFAHKLMNGEHTFTYYMRAVQPGVYNVNPAHVEMMYMPEVYGSSKGEVITINE